MALVLPAAKEHINVSGIPSGFSRDGGALFNGKVSARA